jgi:hypothetical protein
MILTVYDMVNPIYIKTNKDMNKKIIQPTDSEEDIYKTILEPLKFDEAQIVNTNYYFQKQYDANKGHRPKKDFNHLERNGH